MRRLALPLLLTLLPGCESEADVVAEMERGLAATNDALFGSLVAAELFTQVLAPPDRTLRHGTELCGCPCSEKTGALPFVVSLDYAIEGCLPDTGLLPTLVSDHAVLDWDGDTAGVTWDGLAVGGLAIGGSPEAGLSLEGDESRIEVRGPLEVGESRVALDQVIRVDASGVRIEGTATVDDHEPLTLDGVVLPWAGIALPCPAPTAGTATLAADPEVVIRLGQPGDGVVTVERRSRVSDRTDLCAYRSDAL